MLGAGFGMFATVDRGEGDAVTGSGIRVGVGDARCGCGGAVGAGVEVSSTIGAGARSTQNNIVSAMTRICRVIMER